MKKTVFLATATILGGLMAATAVSADDQPVNPVDPHYPTALTANTTANVQFTAPTPSTKPSKPETPGSTPTDPVHPNQPGNNGNTNPSNLLLKWASDFYFGQDHAISSSEMTYSAQQTLTDSQKLSYVPNYAEVYDQRGVNTGWDLTVKQNGEFKGAKTGTTLAGAYMTLTIPSFSEFAGGATSTLKTGIADAASGKLYSGRTLDVMNAGKGTMPGSYFASFHGTATTDKTPLDNGVTLTVPGNAALADSYTTNLTWTLTAAPDDSQTPVAK